MMKRLLLFPLAVLVSLSVNAQFRYTLKDTTTPYAALSTATAVNGSIIWDEEIFSAPMPFSWKMDSTITLNALNIDLSFPGVLADTNDYSDVNGFILGDMDISDRGLLTGISTLSPIRYLTTGTAPNRIFKLEIANAGFYSEYNTSNTMNDYISFQMWVYETSNIVEIHYGPSQISNPTDYFNFGNGPLMGYARHADFDNGTSGKLYFLSGGTTGPMVDSVTLPAIPNAGLDAWPANGKVFRFTPKKTVPGTGVAPIADLLPIRIYPTSAADALHISYNIPEVISYQIVSMEGRILQQGSLRQGDNMLDIKNMTAGVYCVEMQCSKGKMVKRFIKL